MKGASMHCDRNIPTKNADPELTPYNFEMVRGKLEFDENFEVIHGRPVVTVQGKVKEVTEKLKIHKSRKDCVDCMEVMMSASPEYFEGVDRKKGLKDPKMNYWVQACDSFLKQKFLEECIVGFTVHMDEKNPHIHAHVIPAVKSRERIEVEAKDEHGKPKKDDKGNTIKEEVLRDRYELNCKHYTGGVKKMKELQDEFAISMQKWADRSFERGKPKMETGREHISMKQIYQYQSLLMEAGYTKQEIRKIEREAAMSARQGIIDSSPSLAAKMERREAERAESKQVKDKLKQEQLERVKAEEKKKAAQALTQEEKPVKEQEIKGPDKEKKIDRGPSL